MLRSGPPQLARPRGRSHPATTTRPPPPGWETRIRGRPTLTRGGPRPEVTAEGPPRQPPTTRPAPAGHISLLRPPKVEERQLSQTGRTLLPAHPRLSPPRKTPPRVLPQNKKTNTAAAEVTTVN
ncbi:hypothetical protein NDU88_005430 [Pleurodeles waltl]|uniref:Uncharacterized protein n=1 Tax=Pleurodeles waltl TaxID=8319 RepID=A0AAV7RL17_PLEWA|nr:hypothetical protein NDU88_005430 [Pleurodeles waltl]